MITHPLDPLARLNSWRGREGGSDLVTQHLPLDQALFGLSKCSLSKSKWNEIL